LTSAPPDYGANVVIGDLDDKGGAALAQEFGRQGNKTDIFHSSSETRLTLLQRSGLFKKIDVTNWISLRELSEASVATFGSIDCVRANADIPEQSDFQLEDRLDDEGKLAEPKFKLIDVNVNGVLRSTYLYG
jgi:NAD(P)-dependent dehydrogenase (short-subunit alcohol dehydrogenase family)